MPFSLFSHPGGVWKGASKTIVFSRSMNASRYDVIWPTPSETAAGSMPLGNGDLGLNVWVEPNGDLRFYIGKTDAWGDHSNLLKVGRVCVRILDAEGAPLLVDPEHFRWRLALEEGAIRVTTSKGEVRLWVDAHHPKIHVLAEADGALQAEVQIQPWRLEKREIKGGEAHGLPTGLASDQPRPEEKKYYTFPDTIVAMEGPQLVWYHHNQESNWRKNLELQGLGDFATTQQDPLLHRTFGGWVEGENLAKRDEQTLVTAQPTERLACSVTVLTEQVDDPATWLGDIQQLAQDAPTATDVPAWQAHVAWWKGFWERSYIHLIGGQEAFNISQGYALQRFMNACSGRGAYPIKFNGSIFTVDWNFQEENFDADYRRWGPGYWHQNTRLPYWSMLYSGDYEMMRPYFALYRNAVPLLQERCRKFCGHEGGFFSETMNFWGAYLDHNYGEPEQRDEGLEPYLPQNGYIRRHNSSGIELVYHACLFYQHTGDDTFLTETLLPLAEAVIDYYDLHYPRQDGKIRFTPAQVIEQWWSAENPLPEIVGLRAALPALLLLPAELIPAERRTQWQRLLDELPPVPLRELGGKTCFAPAETWVDEPKNQENPELYAIFPYHLCGVDSDDVEVGRESFYKRVYQHDMGWAQDGMQAALLGMTSSARHSVVPRLTTKSSYARFPSFWGPSFDWIPDQDQGGSAAHALQLMLLQRRGDKLFSFAAWPQEWGVEFRLHASAGTVVEGRYQPGQAPEAKVISTDDASFDLHLPETITNEDR